MMEEYLDFDTVDFILKLCKESKSIIRYIIETTENYNVKVKEKDINLNKINYM